MAGHPVEWQGKTLLLGELTAGVKKAYAKWVAQRTIIEARDILEGAEYLQYRQEVLGGGVYWTATPSMAVASSLNSRDGVIRLSRLLFGTSADHLNDDQLWEMLKEKDKDPASDYRIAFDLVWENQDPKAPGGLSGSVAPTDTGTSEPISPSSIPMG